MNTNAAISQKILTNVANGMSLEAAIDAVLGAGTFQKIAGDVWTALQA